MFEELNKKMVSTREKMREKGRLENLLVNVRKELAKKNQRLKLLSEELEKEEQDVKKLEGLTITSLFYQVLGTKDQQLDKERQEFLAAKLKYDSCKNSVSGFEQDIISIENRLKAFGNPEAEYLKLLEEKEVTIVRRSDERIIKLIERSSELGSDLKELKEAILTGNDVLSGLNKVLASLKSAGNWGTFDMLGGGIIATAVKHSKIDDAKQGVQSVQILLHRFYLELSDVQTRPESGLGIEIGSFNTFADYFFDGLIFDWVVQSRIHKSFENVGNMRKNISSIVNRLKKELDKVNVEKERIEEEKKGLIEKVT